MEPLRYFATPGPLTDLTRHREQLAQLPTELAALCGVVQGLIVHPFLGGLYGLDVASMRHDELELRLAPEMVDRILALDPRPLAAARPPVLRLVGNCRHFSVLLCALLRARGVPARARCGFATYFQPGRFVDHWVGEVWHPDRRAWTLVDAQLDARQRDAFHIAFDPLDVPRTQFVVAGDAWQRCRSGRDDPERFGILDMHGLWFVRGNLVRDAAALAKRELLPWDGWGLMLDRDRESQGEELVLLDRVAELSQASDAALDELHALQAGPGLAVPSEIVSFNLGGARVDLPAEVANRPGPSP
jgi:hypothetical protein